MRYQQRENQWPERAPSQKTGQEDWEWVGDRFGLKTKQTQSHYHRRQRIWDWIWDWRGGQHRDNAEGGKGKTIPNAVGIK